MNARQRRQTRRAAIRAARTMLPVWRDLCRAYRGVMVNGVRIDTHMPRMEVARAPGLVVEAADRGEPAIYVLRTYRVDGEERYEVLHREPPVHDCPDCA